MIRSGEPAGREARAPIIESKCRVPSSPDRCLRRPRVDELIASRIAANEVVAIVAAPGAGKTVAVAHALDVVSLPASWLTLDDTEADPARLLAYLAAALAERVPDATVLAAEALSQGLSHREAAGVLIEKAAGRPAVLVVDQLDRVAAAPEALRVIESLLRYAPPSLRIVLVSRRELPLDLRARDALVGSGAVEDDELAFTADEAAAALAGAGGTDAPAAFEAAAGWVAGTLLLAVGARQQLHRYLGSQVLGPLTDAERGLLVATSVFPEVTPARAEALGVAGAAALFDGLRTARLPARWDLDGVRLRCHACFRDYLLMLLDRRAGAEATASHATAAALLEAEARDGEAIAAYLRAGDHEGAARVAPRALDAALERLDIEHAERWLDALRPAASGGQRTLARAELLLALVLERYAAGTGIFERLVASGELEELAGDTAALLAWCCFEAGRPEEARAVVEAAVSGEAAAAAASLLALCGAQLDLPEIRRGPTTDALEALLLRTAYLRGRLRELVEPPASPWAAAVSLPWRIAALGRLGRTQEALKLLETPRAAGSTWVAAVVEPELHLDLGHVEAARDALARARELVHLRGSGLHDALARLTEAKIALRGTRDLEHADAILRALETEREVVRYTFLADEIDVAAATILLLRDQDAAAARRLRQAVRAMTAGDRLLALPTAAVLLAEAEWRLERVEASRKAADLALGAAVGQGSNYTLMRALAEFPAVATRRIEWEERIDSSWHALGRALLAKAAPAVASARHRVYLVEFGAPAIEVDDAAVHPRIKKSYELLAYLADKDAAEAERDELLDALFEGRADDSARSYLRQAAHRLREVLPEGVTLAFEGGTLRLRGDLVVVSDSGRIDTLLARAACEQGRERLETLLEALAVLDRGEYLLGISSLWADERRGHFADLAADLRRDAAELLLGQGDFARAKRLVRATLRQNAYSESAWRLLMRIANACGDEDGVIDAYRQCEQAMVELGTEPSPATKSLLATLRR